MARELFKFTDDYVVDEFDTGYFTIRTNGVYYVLVRGLQYMFTTAGVDVTSTKKVPTGLRGAKCLKTILAVEIKSEKFIED